METPDQHFKAMLEMSYPSSTAADETKSESTPRPTTESATTNSESTHKLVNKVRKLEKDVLYWQDKVRLCFFSWRGAKALPFMNSAWKFDFRCRSLSWTVNRRSKQLKKNRLRWSVQCRVKGLK